MRRPLSLSLLALAACGHAGQAPASLPEGGYIALAHHGTHPVIDTEEEAGVTLGLSTDRASWALVHHYLTRGALPPPEAIRVEDCVTAMAPPPPRTTRPLALGATLAPSPFRPGWHTLVIALAAGPAARTSPPTIVSSTPEAPLERALAAAGAPIAVGTARELAATLSAAEEVIFIGDGAGLGGPDAQAPLLAEVARFRARGGVLSVVGRLAPGMHDALLDRLALSGGGTHEIDTPAEASHLAAALMRAPALTATVASVRFDPARVLRWRLIGHESRVTRPTAAALDPIGGLVRAGDGVHLVFELKLADTPDASPAALGVVRISTTRTATSLDLAPSPADPRHRAVVLVAAFAEKLRGSYWAHAIAWPALARELATLGSPALRDELGALIDRARALTTTDAHGLERPVGAVHPMP